MLKIEKYVLPSPQQWEMVVEGMRNPLNSWDKSDSYITDVVDSETGLVVPAEFFLGEADHKLMMNLVKGGSSHGKFMRMIPVMLTVTAPSFWWPEFDTYKVGTVRNSCSKMHKIHAKEFTIDDFSHEGCEVVPTATCGIYDIIDECNNLRDMFNETHDKKYWRALIELLPHGYMMKATVMLNYEVLKNIYHDRRAHKLDEWHTFCDWIEQLPYFDLIGGAQDGEKVY